MQIWQDDKKDAAGSCCSLSAVDDARRVANKLDIPYYVLNFKEIFDQKVIEYFTSEYLRGKTPNPCIACNRYIKFDEFLRKARSMGMDYVATGHYATVVQENGRYLLKRSASLSKDQTYPLYNLTQDQLAHTLFPLAPYEKTRVREMAKQLGLGVATKPDSQDICFVTDHNYAGFIEEKTGVKVETGDFVDQTGKVLGQHRGLFHYTIGQRKGLGIATGQPMFVTKIDTENNEVVLGEEQDILSNSLIAADLNWIAFDELTKPLQVTAKIRYGFREAAALIKPLDDGRVEVVFEQSVRAVTAGQSVVFYQGDTVVGGGIIQ
jgi:tRNA-specific 2-thiouridylase